MRKVGLALLLVPLALGGCSALGPDTSVAPSTDTSTAPGPVSDAGWVVTVTGSATPKPSPSYGTGTRTPGLPPVTFLPIDPECAKAWTVDAPLIPLQITAGKGALTVTWPRQYESDYRIAAVPQPLVTGSQPAVKWTDVPKSTGCTVTTTITGLKSGTPYVVWLDAPNTGHHGDGTRHPYSGQSGVVYPA